MTDLHAFGAGYGVDTHCFWVETHEQVINTEGTVCGCEDQEMVVGSEQLEDPRDLGEGAYRVDTGAGQSIAGMQM